MKNIVQFITEALSNNYYPIAQMFNEQCKPIKTIKDLKKGDNECYLLLMNNESHKLIKELIVNTEVDENSAKPHVKDVKDTPKWFKRVNMNTNNLNIYYNDDDLTDPNDLAVRHWYSKNGETLFMVWNKENKDKFIKWYEDLTDEAYQQWVQDKENAKKLAEEEKKCEAIAKIEADKKNAEKEMENWPDYLKELRDTYKLKVKSISKTGIYFNVSSKLKSAAESIMNKYGFDSNYDEGSIKLREELNNKLTQDILKGTNYKFEVFGVWQRNSRGRWRGDFYGDPWADVHINIYNKDAKEELARFYICAGRGNNSYGAISLGYMNKKDDINKYVEYLINAFNYIVGNK